MEIVITGKQIRVTEGLRNYIHERAQKAEKYLSHPAHLLFTLKAEKYRKIAEACLKVNGFVLQAEEETDAIPVSIDKAMAKIERQLNRHKEKISSHRVRRDEGGKTRFVPHKSEKGRAGRRALVSKEVQARIGPPIPVEEADFPFLRREIFSMKTLTLDEALQCLTSEKEAFLLFRDRATGQCCLLDRSKEGPFRLLEIKG